MKVSVLALSLCLGLGLATNVRADKDEHAGKNGPCKKVIEACKAAGFVMGGAKDGGKKGLWKDCVEPLKAGQKVEGVTVDDADVQACQPRHGKAAPPPPAAH